MPAVSYVMNADSGRYTDALISCTVLTLVFSELRTISNVFCDTEHSSGPDIENSVGFIRSFIHLLNTHSVQHTDTQIQIYNEHVKQ